MSSTVIIGAGIIGTASAYYLSQSSHTRAEDIHLVEVTPELFCSASGNAGGFLAKDWFSPAVAPLGALSFKLHKELADANKGKEKWGYCTSTGTSLTQGSPRGATGFDWLRHDASRAEAAKGKHEYYEGQGPAWLVRTEGSNLDIISEGNSVAQVDPRRLSQFLLGQCKARGVQFHHPARPVSVSKDLRDHLASVRIQSATDESETDIPCTRLLITGGAWSPDIFRTLFPESSFTPPINSLAGHHLLVRSPRWSVPNETLGCHSVFTTDDSGFSPELFSRIGSEIYVAGLNDSSLRIPTTPAGAEALVDEGSVERLRKVATRMMVREGCPDDLEVIRTGLCFRPVTASGRSILDRIADKKLSGGFKTLGGGEGGVWIAAGHGPWGISLALGTGKVMAEMMEGQPTSADVSGLGMK
ncbi:FAD dependent oxidoreductase [Viridothelium virens]|uniref:FAD dependent oxidoreductase n=1 Tax=Viridothelium virens TaxID=1048519 RepID=A0A6A6HGP2_VIRVR|nr:FAD dependent oxidoreductase [Viridothelium virens]